MVLENAPPPLPEWILIAGPAWLQVVGAVLLSALVAGYLVAALRHGPLAAVGHVWHVLAKSSIDLVHTSPRRTLALAGLAIKESIRKRVVLGMALFLLILMFAGWFLDPSSPQPERLYLSFVLTMTSYMVLLLVLFLSVFSLPSDIRSKTYFTVATKPVRASEVVMGRFLGFAGIGTALLLLMGVCSYLFVSQGLNHTHRLDMEDFVEVASEEITTREGETRLANGHKHLVVLDESGAGRVEVAHGHTHDLIREGEGDEVRYRIGRQRGALVARVPIYGSLSFIDKDGFNAESGENVGDEWTYRSYIEGQTQAAAVWSFEGIDRDEFGDGLPVEMTLGVFRSHKGDITRTILGALSLRNPETGLLVELSAFHTKEFEPLTIEIPTKITGDDFTRVQLVARKGRDPSTGQIVFSPPREVLDEHRDLAQRQEFDLFDDLVADGKVEIWLQCLENAQYLGAAQPDLYIRAADASVIANFFKGYYGIWLQMLVVTAIGVLLSTFLSGPVAMVAALGTLVAGFFHTFLYNLATGQLIGGGPVESFRKLLSQTSLTMEMDPGLATDVTQMTDTGLQAGLRAMSSIIPPLSRFNYSEFVANGYSVLPNVLAVDSITTLGFLIPLFLLGYLFLSNREVAK